MPARDVAGAADPAERLAREAGGPLTDEDLALLRRCATEAARCDAWHDVAGALGPGGIVHVPTEDLNAAAEIMIEAGYDFGVADFDEVAHPGDRLIADYEPSQEELEQNRHAVEMLAVMDAESEVSASLDPIRKRPLIEDGTVERAAETMAAAGYEVDVEHDGDSPSPPLFRFRISPSDALRAVQHDARELLSVRRPTAPVIARTRSPRQARPRRRRVAAGVRVATRGDPSRPRRPRPSDLAEAVRPGHPRAHAHDRARGVRSTGAAT